MSHESGERTTVLVIGGMSGAQCVTRLQTVLCEIAGVEAVGVNLLTRLVTVRHSHNVTERDLIQAVNKIGYQASMACPAGSPRSHVSFGDTIDVIASRRSRFLAGAAFTFLILFINQFWKNNDSSKMLLLFLLATPVQISVGWDYYRGFLQALRRWTFNLDSLVVIGSTAAYMQGFLCFIGHVSNDSELMREAPLFHSAALILTVVSLGKWLESRARESMQQLWGSLAEMAPKMATVFRDGREQVIPAGVVAVGDIVLVAPWEKIPVDGEIIDGATDVDESLFTGDGQRVPKVAGDRVIAASVNGPGFIRLQARGVGVDSTISIIARRVHDAHSNKASIEQLCDRVSATLVPMTVALAAAAFAVWYFGPVVVQGLVNRGTLSRLWLENSSWFSFLLQQNSISAALKPAIAVLVVACPCAVGLATPTAVIVAMGLGARRGILIHGGQAIEAAARIGHVVFGKTGTLTDGTFHVLNVFASKGTERNQVLALAAALESHSEHAIAKGVLREARRTNLETPVAQSFLTLPGRGLKGTVAGVDYIVGSRALMEERGWKLDAQLSDNVAESERDGASVIYLGREEKGILGALALADRVKETSAQAVAELRAQGYTVHLLSGENPSAAVPIGKKVGLAQDAVHSTLDPDAKAQFVKRLKSTGAGVVAVGDGINDAPVLAAADVGVALGVGTDIASESGQIVLVSPDARGVVRALHLMRQAARTIRWNLLWAFGFNLVMIPMAFFNKLDPALAASAMAMSSILVVLNSLRLIYKPHEDPKPPHQQPQPVSDPIIAS